jgi:hypothetical protein
MQACSNPAQKSGEGFMRISLLLSAVAVTGMLAGAVPALASPITVTYDTTPSWNGVQGVGLLTVGGNNTFGQTFVSPTGTYKLNDFTFHVDPFAGSKLQFQTAIFAWSGSLTGTGGQATGPALYTSAPISLLANGFNYQTVTVAPGLTLASGQDYIALLTLSGPDPTDSTNTNAVSFMGAVTGHPAGDGGGGIKVDQGSYAALNSSPWTTASDFGDLAWTAHFSAVPVPEPSSFSLMLSALAILGGVFCLRRRKAA